MKILINKSTLTSICDAVRAATGETGLINIGENGIGFCEAVAGIPAGEGVYAWKRYEVEQVPQLDATVNTYIRLPNYYTTYFDDTPLVANVVSIPLYSDCLYDETSQKFVLSNLIKTWTNPSASYDNSSLLYSGTVNELGAGLYFTAENGYTYCTTANSLPRVNRSRYTYYGQWGAETEYHDYAEVSEANRVLSINKEKGKFIDYVTSDDETAYPADGTHTDGYYYEMVGLVFVPTPTTWTQSNITGANASVYAVDYNDGLYVVSMSGNGLYYSTDGMTWTQGNIKDVTFCCFAYHDGLWLAGGQGNGGIYYSTDGKTWAQSNLKDPWVYNITYGNGIWVAGTSGSGIYYSTDGKTWTQSNITSRYVYGVAYGVDLWVATGFGDGLIYSTDGKTWINSNNTSGVFESVAYGNGIWVAGSYINDAIYYSTDGKNWNKSNITSGTTIYDFEYYDGLWVAASHNAKGLYYSTDGKTWTQSNITNITFANVVCSNGVWAACCEEAGLYYSTDGKNWTQSNIVDGAFDNIVYGDGLWVTGCRYNAVYGYDKCGPYYSEG